MFSIALGGQGEESGPAGSRGGWPWRVALTSVPASPFLPLCRVRPGRPPKGRARSSLGAGLGGLAGSEGRGQEGEHPGMPKKKSAPRAKTKTKTKRKASAGKSPSATGRHLVIVESPSKARTINKYLGSDYIVESSVGHIRDLPASASEIPEKLKKEPWARLGVNVDQGFEPIYIVQPDKKKVLKELKARLKDADELLLATEEMKVLIQNRANMAELRVQAIQDGMTTLMQDGVRKVFQGLTDIKDVRRVSIE